MNRLSIGSILGAIACTGLFSTAAQAFSFTTNASFDPNNPSQGDILLQSVEYDGETISDFVLINQAELINNDLWTGGDQTGGASADLGDLATVGLSAENIDEAQIVEAIGNPYLSSILDVEEEGNFTISLFFEQAADKVFIWERGGNSKLDAQGLDADGNVIGDLLTLDSAEWEFAGYELNTLEIDEDQAVYSLGLTLADLGITDPNIAGIQLSSRGAEYNGPDLKIIGGAAEATVPDIPEPTTLLGLGVVASLMMGCRRRL